MTSTLNKVSLGVFVLLLLVAAAGVVYGVASHSEPGLMEERPDYDATDLPIGICVTAYADGDRERAESAVRAQVSVVNARLGGEVLFVASYPCPLSPIQVVVGAPSDGAAGRDPGGDATFAPGSRRCDVETRNTGSVEVEALVVQHELGHCLGLDHDCWDGSIMCGGACCVLSPPLDGEFPPRIDDHDRDVLRARFFP